MVNPEGSGLEEGGRRDGSAVQSISNGIGVGLGYMELVG